jgi:ABC-type uncharacterized transport system substrate-binding protein
MKTVLLLIALILATTQISEAQQTKKLPRVGFLFIGSKDQPHLHSFRQGLRDLGYVEGKNIAIEYRYAEGKPDALPVLAAEIVALNLDVILTTTLLATRAVAQATSTIPIIAVASGDPVREGLVKSLAAPGANVTGLSSSAGPGMIGKRLELLKQAVPRIRIVAAPWNPQAGQIATIQREEAKTSAKALGIEIRPYEMKSAEDLDAAFEGLKKLHADALLIPSAPLMTRNSRRIAELALKLELPSINPARQFVEDGGLMAYGVNFGDIYRRAATYVDKILKGSKPAELPVEQPTKFELIINLKTAKQIGLIIPPQVLARADKVIK